MGDMRRDEPMSKHTSWRVGGPARWFYTPAGIDDLGRFLKRVPNGLPIAWCGLGSNLLVRDGGFEGAVVCTSKGLNKLRQSGPATVYAEAGVPGSKVARFAVGKSLCGAEFLVGIPGTVGGALAMNAGCFGTETWNIVGHADTISRHGVCSKLSASEIEYGYRFAKMPVDEWFTGAEFNLQPCAVDAGKKTIKSLLRKRAESQPVQTANAGSVFRNPPNDFAARLIDTAGLKGFAIGNACVSLKHANFIENRGRATAMDIERLICHIVDKVKDRHGIILATEVGIIGKSANAGADA